MEVRVRPSSQHEDLIRRIHRYKKRVYSPARIRYPMMRVDFDPTETATRRTRRQQVQADLLEPGLDIIITR